jgi:hypothetical protein
VALTRLNDGAASGIEPRTYALRAGPLDDGGRWFGGPRGGIVHGRACRAEKGALVSTGSGDEERAWAADKRDFVADRRDEVADEREMVADTRDRTADDREAALDKWEGQLDARAAELGGPAERSGASAQRAEARAGRSQARQNRDEARATRTIAAADRDESTKRRQADAPPTRLAMVFADIAEQLYAADSFDDVLSRIARPQYQPSWLPDGERHPP